MLHSLDPRIRRLGALLVLLGVVLLVVGGGLHLHGDHCHEAGAADECPLAVLVAGAPLILVTVLLGCLPRAGRTFRPRTLAPAALRRDARLPLSRAPPRSA